MKKHNSVKTNLGEDNARNILAEIERRLYELENYPKEFKPVKYAFLKNFEAIRDEEILKGSTRLSAVKNKLLKLFCYENHGFEIAKARQPVKAYQPELLKTQQQDKSEQALLGKGSLAVSESPIDQEEEVLRWSYGHRHIPSAEKLAKPIKYSRLPFYEPGKNSGDFMETTSKIERVKDAVYVFLKSISGVDRHQEVEDLIRHGWQPESAVDLFEDARDVCAAFSRLLQTDMINDKIFKGNQTDKDFIIQFISQNFTFNGKVKAIDTYQTYLKHSVAAKRESFYHRIWL